MKHLKRALLIFTVVALVLPCATGCSPLFKLFAKGDESDDSQTNADSDNGNGEVEIFAEPVLVADGNGEGFKIVRPGVSNDVYATCLSELRKPADGFSLDFGVADEEDNGNTDKEILIGNTCRTQTKTQMDKIGYDDFSITYVENKIVVAAHTPDRLIEAVAYLKENLLRVVDGRLEYIGNYTYRSDASLLIGEGDSISDYKIVCGHDNLYMAAYDIQQYIKAQYGAELKIIFDSTPKEGKEIVLGNANRDIARVVDDFSLSEGIVAVYDKDILIATKDSLDTGVLFERFSEEYLSGVYTNHFNFMADHCEKIDNIYSDIFKESAAFTADSDIRVMSFNVLVDIWSHTPAVKGRQSTVSQVIKHYSPDVVGLQEMSINWHRAIKSELTNTPYKLINTEHDHVDGKYGKTNFLPILYNSDTLTLIECDTEEYTEAKVKYLRTMSYACFEHKESGKRFVLLNTHWEDPGDDEEEKILNLEYRNYQTVDMVEMIAELEAKYNCPLLVTGDFNTTEGSDKTGKHAPYWNLVEQAGLSEAKYTADKINRACSTWHELGKSAAVTTKGSFDHIFGTEKVKFTYFNTLIDKALLSASDHCPIYADVVLN